MKSKLRSLLQTLKCTRKELGFGLGYGVLFSAFIYFEWLGLELFWLQTLIALYLFYKLFQASQGTLLITGFTIGILWFYWVGFSFRFVDMSWAVPLIPLIFGAAYALVFWLIGFSSHVFLRAGLFWLLSFYEPFYFNWFKPELLWINSYFGIERWQYGLILAVIALFIYLKPFKYRYGVLVLLLLALDMKEPQSKELPFDLALVQTKFDQTKKWKSAYKRKYISENFSYINDAIAKGKTLIVMPESTFPMFLNHYPNIVKHLKNLSQNITIVAGSLLSTENATYNATFFFHKGEMHIARKMILVPFGEYIPLPKFMRDWINDLVFQNGKDFDTASTPTDFDFDGVKLRNAICYEASCEVFYKDHPQFIVASSNNAWFVPSIEPVLQRMLIHLYAKRYDVIVLHSVNGSKSEIIYP